MIRKRFTEKCDKYAVLKRIKIVKKVLERPVGSGVVSAIIE